MPGKHRLAQTFANDNKVRYFSVNGHLFGGDRVRPIADAGRFIDVGDTWGDEA